MKSKKWILVLLVIIALAGGILATLEAERKARLAQTAEELYTYLASAAREAFIHPGIDAEKTSVVIRDIQSGLGFGNKEYQVEVTYIFTSLPDYTMTQADESQVAFQAKLIYDNAREEAFCEQSGKEVLTFIHDKGVIYENVNAVLDGKVILSAERSRESMEESIAAFIERERQANDEMLKSMKYAASRVRTSYYPPRTCPVCGTGYAANSAGARLIGERGYCKSICGNRANGE